ncbi:MAG: class I SAM-dependent methyltransferase [bacterium]|nr:class I SAM-dependent methyltransferase [bacterium]
MILKTDQELDAEVSKLYEQFSFPNFPINKKEDVNETLIYKLIHTLTKPYLDDYNNKQLKILDVGCGTGELLIGLSNPTWNLLGFDQNVKSIQEANRRANEFNIPNLQFKCCDINQQELPANTYDFIYCIGVLHHLSDPQKIFKKLVAATKPGGYITIGLYNPYGRAQIRVHRQILTILVGNDVNKRIDLAEKLFFRKKLLPHERVFVADLYAHPREKYHTVEDMLEMFDSNNIKFINSAPPITFTQNKKLFQQIIHDITTKQFRTVVNSWQKTVAQESNIKADPLQTHLIQFFWTFLSMGQMVNMIGKKMS